MSLRDLDCLESGCDGRFDPDAVSDDRESTFGAVTPETIFSGYCRQNVQPPVTVKDHGLNAATSACLWITSGH
jgi:hypothetical protein